MEEKNENPSEEEIGRCEYCGKLVSRDELVYVDITPWWNPFRRGKWCCINYCEVEYIVSH